MSRNPALFHYTMFWLKDNFVALDVLALPLMNNTANCDRLCKLLDLVMHEILERTLCCWECLAACIQECQRSFITILVFLHNLLQFWSFTGDALASERQLYLGGAPSTLYWSQVIQRYPLNLSILLSGGKETKMDWLSNGEWSASSPITKSSLKASCGTQLFLLMNFFNSLGSG